MDHVTRETAQERADRVRAFHAELDAMRAEGVLALTGEQQAGIERYHEALLSKLGRDFDIDRSGQARQFSLGLKVASFLGALAMAACVFFLFRQFWGLFGTAAQVGILAASPLLCIGLTEFIARRDDSGYFVKLAATVSFACFVLNVAMLGTIFNLSPSPNAMAAWAACALLLAYGHNIRLLLGLGLLCLMAFLSARMGTFSGIYWLDFGERPEHFIVLGAAVFALPRFITHADYPGFDRLYRVFGLISLLGAVLVLGHWGGGSYLRLDVQLVEGLYQVAGFALSALAVWLGLRWGQPETVNTGNVFFVIFLYTKFYDWWWEIMPKYLFFFVISLAAVLCMLVFRRLRHLANAAATGDNT